MARYRVTICGSSREAMLDLVRKHRVPVLDHGARARRGPLESYSVDAIVEDMAIADLEAKGYIVERHEDVDKAGSERQKEVGRGNRYRQPPTHE